MRRHNALDLCEMSRVCRETVEVEKKKKQRQTRRLSGDIVTKVCRRAIRPY